MNNHFKEFLKDFFGDSIKFFNKRMNIGRNEEIKNPNTKPIEVSTINLKELDSVFGKPESK